MPLVAIGALGEDAMRTALQRTLPDIGDAELAALVAAGEGSPGRALSFAGLDLAKMEDALRSIALGGDADNGIRAELAQSLSAKQAQRQYEAFLSSRADIHCGTGPPSARSGAYFRN